VTELWRSFIYFSLLHYSPRAHERENFSFVGTSSCTFFLWLWITVKFESSVTAVTSVDRTWDLYPYLVTTNFFIVKPTRSTNFTNLFLALNSACFGQFVCPSSGVNSLCTQQRYVIQVCRHHSSRNILILLECCLQTCMTYSIPLLSVQ